MRALLKTARGQGHLELHEVPEPIAGPAEAIVRVSYAGICGTDLHILHDRHTHYCPPVILGHEFAGTVESVSDDIDSELIGCRVVCEPHIGACGSCYFCRRGWSELCDLKRAPGSVTNGAMAARMAVPTKLLHRVPDNVSDRAAALCEPLAVALSAVQRAAVAPGESIVAIGPGPLGMLAGLACRAIGARRVLVVGRPTSARRLDVAQKLGFAVASTPREASDQTIQLTGGQGADVVFDTTGNEAGLLLGIKLVRRRGRLVVLGHAEAEKVGFPLGMALAKAIDIIFSLSSSYTAWEASLSFLASWARETDLLVTEFDLDDWPAAFEAVERRTVVKALIKLG